MRENLSERGLSQRRICEVDEGRLCGSSLPMGPLALPALGLSHWKRTLLPQFHACSFDERVEGPSSSGKGAKR